MRFISCLLFFELFLSDFSIRAMFSSKMIWEAVRTFLCFGTIYVNCKIFVFVSFKRTSVDFHRTVILSFWKVNQIIVLLHSKLLDFGINPQTLAIAIKSLQDVAVPAYLVNILAHLRFLPRLSLKEASKALAGFFWCAMLLPSTRPLCFWWPSPIVHSTPLSPNWSHSFPAGLGFNETS